MRKLKENEKRRILWKIFHDPCPMLPRKDSKILCAGDPLCYPCKECPNFVPNAENWYSRVFLNQTSR